MILSLGVALRGFGAEAPHLLNIILFKEFAQILVVPNLQLIPIVQAGPADRLFRDIKPQRTDQMQPGTYSGTGSGNIAAVLGNFRLHQDDIEHTSHLEPFSGASALAFLLYVKLLAKSIQKS